MTRHTNHPTSRFEALEHRTMLTSISGYVYVDANNNGMYDAGDSPIAGVQVSLVNGTYYGQQPDQTVTTDANGRYKFDQLGSGFYTVLESQPAGYLQGKEGGPNDIYEGIVLSGGVDADNFNFGEIAVDTQPPITPSPDPTPQPTPATTTLGNGMTATVHFWNTRGQRLINSLNGGPDARNLGNWLAANFPDLFGRSAFKHNLAGKTNAQVATFFKTLANAKDCKLDAQVMALALSCYVTKKSLAGNVAAAYGFKVSAKGTGSATVSIAGAGLDFGCANGSILSALKVLQTTNSRSNAGSAYCSNNYLRDMAARTYDIINHLGGID